ncbi:MAG: NB-ARC domain-containing protein [Kibdelosporangium sp.]
MDVEGFGHRRRTNPHQVAIRAGLYWAVQKAFDASGVCWADCYHEDRGDALFVLVPADVPKAVLVESVPPALVVALGEHNGSHPEEQRIRLRMAVHAGEVNYDEHGVVSASLNLAFRLIDAKPLKAALGTSPGLLAMITSGWFYEDVVRNSPAAGPATYRPVRVTEKETSTVGWISLPDHPYPAEPGHLTAPPPADASPRNDLPGDVADFTGRADEVRRLLAAVSDDVTAGKTVVIAAIDGMAGVGKSTLALRAAHQLTGRYPDGQLFLDLHGHTEGRQPMDPATALAILLRAVGAPIEQIPDSLEERSSRWRAELAQRNFLVVLDNAANAAQIRPLLPGTPGSLILVTSRRRLTDLDTTCPLSLDLLSAVDAITLITRIAGPERVAAEPDTVADLARLCGYLPLALRIAAARLRTRPAWSVRHLVDRLGAEHRLLPELSAGDRSVAAAFTVSYEHLTSAQQRVFRLLGLVPGPHWDAYLAAALTDTPVADVEDDLEELLDVHLLTQPVPGRYQFHDLLLEHARAVVHREEPEARRGLAVDRMLDYYCTLGSHAVHAGYPVPSVTDRPFHAPAITTGHPVITSNEQALALLRTERPNLYAAGQSVPDTPATLPRRLQLLTLVAFAQCLGGQGTEGLETTRQVLALIPVEDDARRVSAVMLCAAVERMFGSSALAKSMLRAELRRSPDHLTPATALLHLGLAVDHLVTGDVAEGCSLLDELDTIELDTAMVFAMTVARAMAAYLTGDIPLTLTRMDIADQLMLEMPPVAMTPAEINTWGGAAAWLSCLEVKAGRFDSGLTRMDRTVRATRTDGRNSLADNHMVAFVFAAKSFVLGRMGRLAEATTLAAAAVDAARAVNVPMVLAMALSAQSLLLGWTGDYRRASQAGAEAAQAAAPRLDWTTILARCSPGLVSLYSGNADGGRANVRAACDEHEFLVRDETVLLVLLEALAYAEAVGGSPETVADLADRADRVRHPAHVTNVAMADLVRAHCLTRSDPARSAELSLRAADVLCSAGLRLDEGRARLRAGLSLANAGRIGRALTELAASATLFDACGARDLYSQASAAHNQIQSSSAVATSDGGGRQSRR